MKPSFAYGVANDSTTGSATAGTYVIFIVMSTQSEVGTPGEVALILKITEVSTVAFVPCIVKTLPDLLIIAFSASRVCTS